MRTPNPHLVPFTFLLDHRQRDKLAVIAKREDRSVAAKLRVLVDDEIARDAREQMRRPAA